MHDRSSDGARPMERDTLSEVLRDLRPVGVAYGHCVLSRPWGIELPAEHAARLHLVVRGSTWMRQPDGDWIELRRGDVALLPRGLRHAVADRPDRTTRPLSRFPTEEIGDRTYRLRAGGDGAGAIMSCCGVCFAQPSLHPLLDLTPAVLLVRAAADRDPTLPTLLQAMADEVLRERIGAATVLARLADVVIVRLIRSWAESRTGAPSGWLAAIRDPKIGRALAAIHREPGRDWTVDRLAHVAAMSRSVFSGRFAAAVGAPPARYVARWRTRLAMLWFRERRITVAQAAARLGYGSEAAFSRAFSRTLGMPPSAARRAAADPARDTAPR